MPRSTRKSSKKAGADTKGSATAAADSNDPVDELIQQQSGVKSNPPGESQNVIDEWVPDLEELKKELQKNQPPEQ